jgi:hypothetical protein
VPTTIHPLLRCRYACTAAQRPGSGATVHMLCTCTFSLPRRYNATSQCTPCARQLKSVYVSYASAVYQWRCCGCCQPQTSDSLPGACSRGSAIRTQRTQTARRPPTCPASDAASADSAAAVNIGRANQVAEHARSCAPDTSPVPSSGAPCSQHCSPCQLQSIRRGRGRYPLPPAAADSWNGGKALVFATTSTGGLCDT